MSKAILAKKVVKRPGSRGGKFYYSEDGFVRYGTRPITRVEDITDEDRDYYKRKVAERDNLLELVLPIPATFEEFRDAFSGDFGDKNLHSTVESFMDANGVTMRGYIWKHPNKGEKLSVWDHKVGRITWKFGVDEEGVPSAILEDLIITSNPMFQTGFGRAYVNHVEGWLASHGIKRIYLQANVSVGKYAWAKQGYTYATDQIRSSIIDRFEDWATENRISLPKADVAKLRQGTAQDLAEYDLGGKTIHTEFGRDVNGEYKVGKAFLLGTYLLNGWWGRKALDNKA